MKRLTWEQINDLFEAARKLPPEERTPWVRAATADKHVQSEVLSLLHAHEDDPWFVDEPGRVTPARVTPARNWPGKPTPPASGPTPAAGAAPDAGSAAGRAATASGSPPARRAAALKAGTEFAAYRLAREIARDSARTVFEAVATGASTHPRVSLHVLAADARDPAFSLLLHTEGHVIASLDHPGIPRLLDGGETEDGTAYLAFEYAAGDPIDVWCRERKLKAHDRVVQVLAVCDAVEHAHQHLVGHGDLRPANILILADGQVKLIDCGMRRLLAFAADPARGEAPVHHYMSPEQARGDELTTASDVYALGVLLYTLVTGYPPYEINGQTPARARQMICGTEPDVPSTIVGASDKRVLAGTLDRIILKALRKNPRERYPTAAALAADLRAWRAGRPAPVAPPTRGWRVTGARGVHPARIITTAVILALLAGVGTLGWQLYLLRGERDQALANISQGARAQRAIKTAADERLAKAAQRPPVADLRIEIAGTTNELGLTERRGGNTAKAEALWTQALSDLRPVLDASPADIRALALTADVHASLGSLCRSLRRFDESLAHYREALRARERTSAASSAPASSSLLLAMARTDVARLLLDLLEIRAPGPASAARLREAGGLLAAAGPVLRDAAAASSDQQGALAELNRQTDRFRRLSGRPRQ